MEQLKMYLLPPIDVPELTPPAGYSIIRYMSDKDQEDWVECCKNGALINEEIGTEAFKEAILERTLDVYQDVLFLVHNGERIATATCYVNEQNEGDLHMVGMKEEYRGHGLSKYIVYEALRNLNGKNVKYIFLTTDEFRKGAIKTYLNAGFLPVDYDQDMKERWEGVLKDINVESALMLNDDGSVKQTIYRAK